MGQSQRRRRRSNWRGIIEERRNLFVGFSGRPPEEKKA
jgi:hypothetical protein